MMLLTYAQSRLYRSKRGDAIWVVVAEVAHPHPPAPELPSDFLLEVLGEEVAA